MQEGLVSSKQKKRTHVAEDHGLRNCDGAIDVAEGMEFLLTAVAQDVILLDGVQSLFLPLQLDDVGVGDNFLEEQHLAVFGNPPLPLDADALILVTLGGYHDIGFIQDKDFDLLGVNEFQLGAPIQDGARCANDNLFSNLLFTLTFVASNRVGQLQLRIKPAHLLDHLPCLKSQLIGWREAETLKEEGGKSGTLS
uniref:Uncharacterized protein n=1 Tax=Podarcis muralis TaxID=64176 RepID=A0A670J517_PODMU